MKKTALVLLACALFSGSLFASGWQEPAPVGLNAGPRPKALPRAPARHLTTAGTCRGSARPVSRGEALRASPRRSCGAALWQRIFSYDGIRSLVCRPLVSAQEAGQPLPNLGRRPLRTSVRLACLTFEP